jgi:predicted PurR-regulated permease PerM
MDQNRFEQYARAMAIAALALGCLFVIWPFLPAMVFAAILCMSTWPAFVWLKARLRGNATLTALVFALAMLVCIGLPVALATQSLISHSPQILETLRGFADNGPPDLPKWIVALPMVGSYIDSYWHTVLESREELIALGRRFADPGKRLLIAVGSAAGEGLFQIFIATFLAFFFYRDGERAAALIRRGFERLAGSDRGMELLATAVMTTKGVVYGLIGTAIAQAFVALVGFLIAGVPGAFLLAALTFILSLVPMGPVFIWGGAAAWLYAQGQTGWAIFMLIYGFAVISSVDNFVKPILMSRAGGLSMLLVVLGVFGGAIAFGFIGLFVGPVLLALAWSLTASWLATDPVREAL